jgi:hypothetical protein
MPYIDATYLLSTPLGSARRSRAASGLEALCVLERTVYWLQVSMDPRTSSASFARRSSSLNAPSLDEVVSSVKKGGECFRTLDVWSRSSSEASRGDDSEVRRLWAQSLQHFSGREDPAYMPTSWASAELELIRARSRIVRSLSAVSDRATTDRLLDCASEIVELEVLRSVRDGRGVSSSLLCPLLADDPSALELCSSGIQSVPLRSFESSTQLAAFHAELERSVREIRGAAPSLR